VKNSALGWFREVCDGSRPGERAVGERMVISLDNVVESKGGMVIAGDGEADGIRPVVIWKSATNPAGIAEIAERPQ
jgi:hypothetical protein